MLNIKKQTQAEWKKIKKKVWKKVGRENKMMGKRDGWSGGPLHISGAIIIKWKEYCYNLYYFSFKINFSTNYYLQISTIFCYNLQILILYI